MLWTYERSSQALHIETKFDNAANEYVLTIRPLDGTAQIERFPDVTSFQKRIDELERQLQVEQWENRSMVPLGDGWKV